MGLYHDPLGNAIDVGLNCRWAGFEGVCVGGVCAVASIGNCSIFRYCAG